MEGKDDFDDSINLRLSNPSENSRGVGTPSLFKTHSLTNDDKKSGFFPIAASP